MYRKYGIMLLLGNLVWMSALFCTRGVEINRVVAAEAFIRKPEIVSKEIYVEEMVSSECIVEMEELVPEKKWELSERDYETLLKIVEAEAGTEDLEGKLLIANVVLNRVEDERFPDSVTEVVYQCAGGKAQFSPVSNGKIHRVKISPETEEAVELAVWGKDISEGALYFAARRAANAENMRWFDTHLTKLFAHGGHEFFE